MGNFPILFKNLPMISSSLADLSRFCQYELSTVPTRLAWDTPTATVILQCTYPIAGVKGNVGLSFSDNLSIFSLSVSHFSSTER